MRWASNDFLGSSIDSRRPHERRMHPSAHRRDLREDETRLLITSLRSIQYTARGELLLKLIAVSRSIYI